MCPDERLICVHVDGELESPWRERLEKHLAACSRCAGIERSYRSLSTRLVSGAMTLPGEAEALARLHAAGPGIATGDGGRPAIRLRTIPFSERYIRISAPIATAAALLVVVLAGVVASTFVPRPGATFSPAPMVAGITSYAPGESFEELVRSVAGGEDQTTLVIHLPERSDFASRGEPVLMTVSSKSGTYGTR